MASGRRLIRRFAFQRFRVGRATTVGLGDLLLVACVERVRELAKDNLGNVFTVGVNGRTVHDSCCGGDHAGRQVVLHVHRYSNGDGLLDVNACAGCTRRPYGYGLFRGWYVEIWLGGVTMGLAGGEFPAHCYFHGRQWYPVSKEVTTRVGGIFIFVIV